MNEEIYKQQVGRFILTYFIIIGEKLNILITHEIKITITI